MLAASGALLLALLAGPLATLASGGVKTDDGRWYFRGSTYSDEDGQRPSDPVNIIFYGGGDVTNLRVKRHLEDDWRYGYMRNVDGWCRVQGAQWPGPRSRVVTRLTEIA